MATRVSVSDVLRMERVIGGDPVTEDLVLRFIQQECGARSLCYVPSSWVTAIAHRPQDFLAKVRNKYAPELSF